MGKLIEDILFVGGVPTSIIIQRIAPMEVEVSVYAPEGMMNADIARAINNVRGLCVKTNGLTSEVVSCFGLPAVEIRFNRLRIIIVTVDGVELKNVVAVKDVTYRRMICARTGPLSRLDYEVSFLDGSITEFLGHDVVVSYY